MSASAAPNRLSPAILSSSNGTGSHFSREPTAQERDASTSFAPAQVIEIGARVRTVEVTEPGQNGAPSKTEEEPLLNARQVAVKLGVSERWVRDHTTRRSPRIRGVKLGPLMRYRRHDVEAFMRELDTTTSSRGPRRGV